MAEPCKHKAHMRIVDGATFALDDLEGRFDSWCTGCGAVRCAVTAIWMRPRVALRVTYRGESTSAEESLERLATIADEAFGPFPVQTAEENLAAIEKGIFEQRLRISELENRIAGWRASEEVACQNLGDPPEGCDCEGCTNARKQRETK